MTAKGAAMIDIPAQIGAIERSVRRTPRDDGGENVTVLASRTYAADPEEAWSALTDPSRIARWLMPISGDLRQGGSFQLEGNAGGDILECDRPNRFRVTFGSETSFLEVRLSPDGNGATRLELEHTMPIEMAQSGAGAMWVGPGWDGAMMGLDLHLTGDVIGDPVAGANSPEALVFSKVAVQKWADAVEASGTATPKQLAEAVQVSMAQFAPDAAAEES
jgi:uncharacterized protein YndB with AHSA1/START domain